MVQAALDWSGVIIIYIILVNYPWLVGRDNMSHGAHL